LLIEKFRPLFNTVCVGRSVAEKIRTQGLPALLLATTVLKRFNTNFWNGTGIQKRKALSFSRYFRVTALIIGVFLLVSTIDLKWLNYSIF